MISEMMARDIMNGGPTSRSLQMNYGLQRVTPGR